MIFAGPEKGNHDFCDDVPWSISKRFFGGATVPSWNLQQKIWKWMVGRWSFRFEMPSFLVPALGLRKSSPWKSKMSVVKELFVVFFNTRLDGLKIETSSNISSMSVFSWYCKNLWQRLLGCCHRDREVVGTSLPWSSGHVLVGQWL